jgi:hypothetical protein
MKQYALLRATGLPVKAIWLTFLASALPSATRIQNASVAQRQMRERGVNVIPSHRRSPCGVMGRPAGVIENTKCACDRIGWLWRVSVSSDPPRSVFRPAAMPIKVWYRAAAIALGLVGLGSGGAAVYITHLEAGPVALLAEGLILLLIGMGGRMPSRIRAGDYEAAWEMQQEAMQQFVECVTDEIPEVGRPELLSALSDLADAAPQVALVGLGAVAYEQLVVGMIYDAFRRDIPEIVGTVSGARTADDRADMVVATPDRVIRVQIRYNAGRADVGNLRLIAAKMSGRPDTGRRVVGLLVTRGQLTDAARATLDSLDMYVAVVESVADRGKLQEALRGAVQGGDIHYWY